MCEKKLYSGSRTPDTTLDYRSEQTVNRTETKMLDSLHDQQYPSFYEASCRIIREWIPFEASVAYADENDR